MKIVTTCPKKHDEIGAFSNQIVMVFVTSLSYQTDTTGGANAAEPV